MISGKVSDLKLYFTLNPCLEYVEKFLQEYFAQPKPDGDYEIIPGRLKASIATYETVESSTRNFEAHRQFCDVQVILKGNECIEWADIDSCTEQISEEYSKGGDIAFYAEPALSSSVALSSGMFLVARPEDAHKPCIIASDKSEQVTKVVFKIKL